VEEECNQVPYFCGEGTRVKEVFSSFTIVHAEEAIGMSNKSMFEEVFPSE